MMKQLKQLFSYYPFLLKFFNYCKKNGSLVLWWLLFGFSGYLATHRPQLLEMLLWNRRENKVNKLELQLAWFPDPITVKELDRNMLRLSFHKTLEYVDFYHLVKILETQGWHVSFLEIERSEQAGVVKVHHLHIGASPYETTRYQN